MTDKNEISIPPEVSTWLLNADGMAYVRDIWQRGFDEGFENGQATAPLNLDWHDDAVFSRATVKDNEMTTQYGDITIRTNEEGWQKVLEGYFRDSVDGRLYFDDLMDRVVQGRFPSLSFEDYSGGRDQEIDDADEAGYERGFQSAIDSYGDWCEQ